MMKAYVLHQVNDLRYDDIDLPPCPEGWVLVKVKAAGICSSDIPRIFTKGTYHFPTIPGHEFSGIVESVGSENDSSLVGKHVGIFPLIPCKECVQCKNHQYEMCAHYDYIGSRRDGAFAEFVSVPVWNLIPLNNNVPFTSSAMLEPLSVALHALRQGGLVEGAEVGIVGTGMIGIAAGLWGQKLRASKVTIIGRNEDKRNLVERCGLNYTTELGEYDFVLEAVGTPESVSMSVRMTSPGGNLVLMGNPSGDITMKQDVYWRILRKQLHVCGTWNSSYNGSSPSDWTEAVRVLNNEEMNISSLITHQYTQERLFEGLELMKNKKEPYCKVMTTWND